MRACVVDKLIEDTILDLYAVTVALEKAQERVGELTEEYKTLSNDLIYLNQVRKEIDEIN